MSETKKRKVHTAEFKAKVGLKALGGMKTVNEIAQEFGVNPGLIHQWKKDIVEQAKTLFEGKRGPKALMTTNEETTERLYGQIGRLKVELDWLKKVRDQPAIVRQSWVIKDGVVPLSLQCVLAGVCRAPVYAKLAPKITLNDDLEVSAVIDEEYSRHPFYGSRKMVVFLRRSGRVVNRKKVRRLMQVMGLAGMAPGPNTSKAQPQHKVYPYLPRGGR